MFCGDYKSTFYLKKNIAVYFTSCLDKFEKYTQVQAAKVLQP
jgi:hypothetical protein